MTNYVTTTLHCSQNQLDQASVDSGDSLKSLLQSYHHRQQMLWRRLTLLEPPANCGSMLCWGQAVLRMSQFTVRAIRQPP